MVIITIATPQELGITPYEHKKIANNDSAQREVSIVLMFILHIILYKLCL